MPLNCSMKTAKDLSARSFVEIFGAADAALLTQGKDKDYKKSAERLSQIGNSWLN